MDTATSDGQEITARYTVRFRIEPETATSIVNNLGTEEEVVEKLVKQNSRVWVRTLLRNFTANQLYSGDIQEAQEAIASQLKGDLESEGLQLVFFGLRQITFSDAYIDAVENKQIEAENITTKQNLARQAEFEKQRAITAVRPRPSVNAWSVSASLRARRKASNLRRKPMQRPSCSAPRRRQRPIV